MIHSKADLSFLNYRDEEDLARDAAVYWKYFSKKHHSPALENMVEWAATTEELPKKQRKPAFEQLPQLRAQMAAEKTAGDFEIERKYGQIYKGKRERRAAIERWREQRRREIKQLHDQAWAQKENRDAAIKRIKDGYYWAKTAIDKSEYVHLCPEPRVAPRQEQGEFVQVQRLRPKTHNEMFQDVLDAQFAEIGDENKARVDAEIYVVLELGLEPLEMDLAVPATARGALIEDFEQQAYRDYVWESLRVPFVEKSEAELEQEIAAEMRAAKKRFLEKEWLENLKPARQDERDGDHGHESFDIFQIMEAWVRKYGRVIPREEKEAMEEVIKVGQKQYLSQIPVKVPDEDVMVAAMKKWAREDLQNKVDQFCKNIKTLEQKYGIFYWLLSVPIVKDFISKNSNVLLLRANFDVQETVLQVEILTHVYMHPELEKSQVEEFADEFLNSWIRLQDGNEQDYRQLLVQEFATLANELIRGNYSLVGSWTKVREMIAEVASMTQEEPPNFNFHPKLSSYLQN